MLCHFPLGLPAEAVSLQFPNRLMQSLQQNTNRSCKHTFCDYVPLTIITSLDLQPESIKMTMLNGLFTELSRIFSATYLP